MASVQDPQPDGAREKPVLRRIGNVDAHDLAGIPPKRLDGETVPDGAVGDGIFHHLQPARGLKGRPEGDAVGVGYGKAEAPGPALAIGLQIGHKRETIYVRFAQQPDRRRGLWERPKAPGRGLPAGRRPEAGAGPAGPSETLTSACYPLSVQTAARPFGRIYHKPARRLPSPGGTRPDAFERLAEAATPGFGEAALNPPGSQRRRVGPRRR
jgi:hypothetical protein